MKYAITGGCGFVGTNIAAALIDKGLSVTLFDNVARTGSASNLGWLQKLGDVRFLHGDVRNPFDVEQFIREQRPDIIFHLAGQVAMTTSMQSPRRDFEVNVLGSINLLEAVRMYAPEAVVVYASSNKVYGDLSFLKLVEKETRYQPSGPATGVDESAPLEFHTPYGCSKGSADQYMLDYARNFGVNTVVFRHSTIYGGRQFSTFDQGWVGWFCRQALETRAHRERSRFTISGDGKQVRDLLHVSDAVRCYLAGAECIATARGEAFNIGGGAENSMSLLELFAVLEEDLSVTLDYDRLPWRPSDQKYFVADNAKATKLLNWKPSVSYAEGLQTVLRWESELVHETALAELGP